MIFAERPNHLDPHGVKPLGQCKGWVHPRMPEGGYGYATDDVFFL